MIDQYCLLDEPGSKARKRKIRGVSLSSQGHGPQRLKDFPLGHTTLSSTISQQFPGDHGLVGGGGSEPNNSTKTV